jgi:N-acetylmuramoyl-L-alanine amidase
MTWLRGKVSWFGGPDDMGVAPDEGLAFIYEVDDAPHLFLTSQPPGTTGLARRLDPARPYIACRWNYDEVSKTELLQAVALVRANKTGKAYLAYPADWGPHQDTDRIADISPGLMAALGIETDDEVEVIFPYQQGVAEMTYSSIVISSGHGKYVRGASGILDEVDEARRVVERVADKLEQRGVDVAIFYDNTSQTQSENLDCIVAYHNSQDRDLDVSIHFNAYVETTKPMGCEVLYVTQSALAADISCAIAEAGDLIDRGAKKRTDLAFLNGTAMPSVLVEVAFVDSSADAEAYECNFDAICEAIATVLGGAGEEIGEPPGEELPPPVVRPPPTIRIDVEVTGDITIIVNGVPVT